MLPKGGWLAQRSTVYRIFYHASATLLETALHTINIKCNGAFPGAVQERLGSLHDHSFVVLYTAPLYELFYVIPAMRTVNKQPVLLIFTKSSKRVELLVIRFEILLSQQFRSNESWGTWNQCKSNTCVLLWPVSIAPNLVLSPCVIPSNLHVPHGHGRKTFSCLMWHMYINNL